MGQATLLPAALLQRGTAAGVAEEPSATERSLLGLNWLNFLVAAMQMGFGPFLSVFLTAQRWNPENIGFALSIATVSAMAAQLPLAAYKEFQRLSWFRHHLEIRSSCFILISTGG